MSDKLRNFIVRTLSGAVLLLVILLAMWVGYYGYLALLLLITVGGVWEFYTLSKVKGYEPQRGLGIVLSLLIFLVGASIGIYLACDASCDMVLVAKVSATSIVLMLGMIFFAEVFRNRATPIANVATTLAGAIYVAFPMALMAVVPLFLTEDKEWKALYFLFYLFLVWGNDVFAYLAGVTMGRHKMCERLSPKKSWEGFIGGVLGSLAVGALASSILNESCGVWIGLALVVSLASVVGDLVESMFKRDAGVKDSGNILPGHGGILDRFDAFILAAPFAFLYLLLAQMVCIS
ncbi:MAG: phosphatidate cytidylyltransferase [Alistipes sp.]|nr:phosphatidate cytidylyltransferase [Alistipes sp.]